ncbi:unnamed protein product [Hymenolepis diminuta]|uniref:UBA domain-containing protein n=1 Tax=Hymenolepis diminuta TaxID=6216 RepID=A0A0R3SSC7_HYMDI|nr:unnamed protein product [Hymenolepis diminuta]
MSNQPKNSDIWNYEPTGSSNLQEVSSLWPSSYLHDGTHLSRNIPNGSANSSTIPDFPSIWNRYTDEQNLVTDFSRWSLNQPSSPQAQNFLWNEPSSNLPQISSNNVPGNDVFQSLWSDSSWPLNKEPIPSPLSAQNETNSQDTILSPSSQMKSSKTQEISATELDASSELKLSQSNQSQSQTDMEKLIKERINNPGKWGQKPIEQSTPWHDDDDVKSPRQRQDSNVWRSEPPTGAQIWDSLQAGPSTPTTSLNGSVALRISPQALFNQSLPSTFNNWNYPSTGSFSSRSQFPSHGTSQGFGPPGSYRRQIQGATTSTSISRQSNDNSGLGGPPMSSHRLNAWPSPSTNEIQSGNNLGHRSSTWASRSNMDAPLIGNFLEGHFRNSTSGINNVPNTLQPMPSHRSSLLNYFMQQGFPRGDVEEVLSTGSTDIDQCLAALRALQSSGGSTMAFRGAQRNLTGTRLLSSPSAPSENVSFFGSFSNNQSALNAPYGRGNAMRSTTRSNSMNQGGGALGPLSGGPFNTSIGGGAGGDDGLMSSLLGRPPAQTPSLSSFLEGPSNTAAPPMRNFLSSPNFSSVMSLLALKNEIQMQLNEFNEKPFMLNSPNGKKVFADLNFQLLYLNMQLLNANNNSGASGGFGPNSMNEENWLLIRDMSASIPSLELGNILDCTILEFHDFPVPGNYLIRVGSAEIAREVKRRCDAQFSSIIPNVVIMSGEAAAGVLMESAKLKNPVPAAVFS